MIVIRLDFFLTVLRARTNTSRGAASPHFAVYSFVPDILSTHPFLGLGLNNFAVYYEFVTGRPDFGPHSFYVATIVETGIVGAVALRRVRRLDLPPARRGAADRPRALRGARPARRADPARRVGDDGCARRDARRERLLPHDDLLLLLRLRDARGRAPGRGSRRAARMKVVVLTTSYPREPDDVAGVFVRDAVEHLRAAGVEVDVVSPASFRHFGLAYGDGIVGNLRRRPWKALLVPAFPRSRTREPRAARRVTPTSSTRTGSPRRCRPRATGKPFVLQLWGTDVELARRVPWAARRLVRRARLVLCPSEALAAEASALGAREVRVVPSGVALPDVGRRAGRPAARPLRRAGSPRRRGSPSCWRRPRACRA